MATEEVVFTSFNKAMAIVPKITGFISLCSSTFLVQHVFRNKKRRNLTYHKLLGFMSISDIFGSLMCVLSTWPIPRNSGTYGAIGTVATCEAAGFFNQSAALATPTFNVSLAIYYILVIVYGWKERRVHTIEGYLIAVPFILGISTGIAGLFLNLFNGAGWICWIAPGGEAYPERTNPDYGIYRLAFLYADAWVIIVILAISMIIIYAKTLKTEKGNDKWRSSAGQDNKRNHSIKIRNQAFLYVGCMYMTWCFGTIFRVMQFAGAKPPKAIVILFVTFFPLQGFFNLIVYMYPRWVSEKEKNPDGSLSTRITSIFGLSISHSVPKTTVPTTTASLNVSEKSKISQINEGDMAAGDENHIDEDKSHTGSTSQSNPRQNNSTAVWTSNCVEASETGASEFLSEFAEYKHVAKTNDNNDSFIVADGSAEAITTNDDDDADAIEELANAIEQ